MKHGEIYSRMLANNRSYSYIYEHPGGIQRELAITCGFILKKYYNVLMNVSNYGCSASFNDLNLGFISNRPIFLSILAKIVEFDPPEWSYTSMLPTVW